MSIELDRGPCINDIERLDDVLPLAIRIASDTTDIFKINLPMTHRRRAFYRLMGRFYRRSYSIVGACRIR